MVKDALASQVKYNLRTVRSRIATDWHADCEQAEAEGKEPPKNPLQHEKKRMTVTRYVEPRPESSLGDFSSSEVEEPETLPATQTGPTPAPDLLLIESERSTPSGIATRRDTKLLAKENAAILKLVVPPAKPRTQALLAGLTTSGGPTPEGIATRQADKAQTKKRTVPRKQSKMAGVRAARAQAVPLALRR